MPIVSKDILILDFDTFKAHNGFSMPIINDDDIENGITTPEKKYSAWSYYTQIILNAMLQEKLANDEYKLSNLKPWAQKAVINIMVVRLNRAFSNDEILPRDSQVQLSQQGGINYSSNPSQDAKNALYSFFNGTERLLITTSGLLDTAFGEEDDIDIFVEDNQFKDGPFVPELNWGDKANNILTYDGNNMSVENAIGLIASGKVNNADLIDKIKEATGLETSAIKDEIKVSTNKYIKYETLRLNKAQEELAQIGDITASEARSRADIVSIQRVVSNALDEIKSAQARISALEEAQQLIENVWEGQLTLTGDDDISVLEYEPGKTFDFKAGERKEYYIRRKQSNNGIGHNVKTDDTIKIDFVMPIGSGQSEHVTALVKSNGHLITHETGSGNIGDYELFRIIDPNAKFDISAHYDKNEIDIKMAKKQDKDLPANFPTNDKTVEGSLKEIFNKSEATENRVNVLDGKDVTMEDGTIQDLDQINEPIASKKYVDKEISKIPAGGGGVPDSRLFDIKSTKDIKVIDFAAKFKYNKYHTKSLIFNEGGTFEGVYNESDVQLSYNGKTTVLEATALIAKQSKGFIIEFGDQDDMSFRPDPSNNNIMTLFKGKTPIKKMEEM